jgi:hypothetical protein
MRHIKKDKKVVCPVCAKEFTHSASLKNHIIKNHQTKEVLEKGVAPVQVVGDLTSKKVLGAPKTDFLEIQQMQVVLSGVKCEGALYEKVMSFTDVCPRLYQLLLRGIPSGNCPILLNKPISVQKVGKYFVKGYRYEEFRKDYQLG